MSKHTLGRVKIKPVQVLALGFLAVLLIGAGILMLPISTATGEKTSFIDALFTSTSAVCVTGLTTVDTASHWSYFGKTVIICLIQIGGLGFMSFATLFALILGKRVSLKERLILQEAVNTTYISGIIKLVKYILSFTFTIEGIGSLILSTQFIPSYGFVKGIYFSIFHAISAFCNAGFDLIGNSLLPYQNNAVVILTISILVIIGSLGFAVLLDLFNASQSTRFYTHTKFVLTLTAIFLISGTVFIFIMEYNNPETLGSMGVGGKLLNAFFASVSSRTAGFYSVPLMDLTTGSIFLYFILMFIGGSPGSTAGGVKTTTVGLICLTVISGLRGKEDTELFKRRISKDVIYKAFSILFLSIMIVITITMLLSNTESDTLVNGQLIPLENLIFEAISAFGTVGVTLGITPYLSFAGKLLIILTMYIGRVGPITLVMAITRQKKKNAGNIKYPEAKILIG